MKIRKLQLVLVMFSALVLILNVSFASANPKKPSVGKCKEVGKIRMVSGAPFLCTKVGSKQRWLALPKNPAPTQSQFQPITPPRELPVYKGGPGGSNIPKSMEIPVEIPANADRFNVRLWLSDPVDRNRPLSNVGVWSWQTGQRAVWLPADQNGFVMHNWSEGNYSASIPEINPEKYSGRVYNFRVNDEGKVRVQGLQPNSKGFYTLTLDLVKKSKDIQFIPKNECQIRNLSNNNLGGSGFPRNPDRLPVKGTINALIAPVDFEDVPGKDDPRKTFYEFTERVQAYFTSVSSGKVSFDFQALDKYVRMPFKSNTHGLRSLRGDFGGFWRDSLNALDDHVDFSKFDAVYVMVPREIPRRSILFGPAFLIDIHTDDGIVRNGTFSSAVTYEEFPTVGWKWMAHETGHLFGLIDLYDLDGPVFGSWDLMEDAFSNRAIELSSWNRYLLDWLSEEQVSCITTIELDIKKNHDVQLVPLVGNMPGKKAQFVRLSEEEVLVLELRVTGGLDLVPAEQSGVLAYVVNTRIGSTEGAWRLIRKPGSKERDLTDAALRTGDSVEVQGIKITVTDFGMDGAKIVLSKN